MSRCPSELLESRLRRINNSVVDTGNLSYANGDLLICNKFNVLQYLLNDPDLSYPVNESAAKLYRENRTEYNKKVRECVKESLLPADTE